MGGIGGSRSESLGAGSKVVSSGFPSKLSGTPGPVKM